MLNSPLSPVSVLYLSCYISTILVGHDGKVCNDLFNNMKGSVKKCLFDLSAKWVGGEWRGLLAE